MQKLKIGTLISDNNKLGVITKVIEVGTLNTKFDLIRWRANYEVHYTDGVVSILGCTTMERLIKEGKITIVFCPTTPLPPSSSSEDILRESMSLHDTEEKKNKSRRKSCGAQKPKKDQ